MARLAGTGIASRSPGFSVCTHPVRVESRLLKDLDNPNPLNPGFGIITRNVVISDTGILGDLDQVQVSEIIEEKRHDEPPFKTGHFTGAGTSGGQVNDLQFMPPIPPPGNIMADINDEPRPDPGPAGQAEFYQVFVFKCARCGLALATIANSGFDIKYEVSRNKDTGRWKYEIRRSGFPPAVAFGGLIFGADTDTITNPPILVKHDLP